MREYEQSSEMSYLPKPQKTLSLDYAINTYMEDCSPMPQSGPHYDEFNNYPSCAWEDQNKNAINVSYSINQEPSSLEQTFNSFMQNCPTLPHSFLSENSSSFDYASAHESAHTSQNNFTTMPTYPETHSQPLSLELVFEQYFQTSIDSGKEQKTLCNKMDGYLEQARKNKELLIKEDEDQLVDVKEEVGKQDEEVPVSSEISMKNEVVEVFEPKTAYPQKPLEI
ncbi:hypothetical protein AHAS_Ahas20G0200200 [Arachis hypogaea]